jgi:phage-related protein
VAYNLGTASGEIRLEYDDRGVLRARDSLGRFVSTSGLMGDNVDKDGKKVERSFALMGASVLKYTAYVLAAGAASNILSHAIVGIVGLGQALIPVITATLATLPGIILAAVGAIGVLKAALSGMGDAIKAAFAQDASKFSEAIKKLAPEAQAAAKSFYALGTAAKPVQQAIQNAFFAATAPLVDSLIPAIQKMQPFLVAVASGFNLIVKALLGFAGSQAFVDAVSKSMEGLAGFLNALAPGFAPLLEGFSKLASQAGKFFSSFGDSAGQALAKFGEFLGGLDLDAMWQTASTVLKNLGTLFQDLGSVVGSIVGAFTGAGAAVDDFGKAAQPLSNALGEVVAKFAEFLKSAEGTSVLNALAQAFSSIASAGGDVLMSLLQGLAPILVELGPLVQSLARALGPVLGAAIAALSPLLTAVANGLRTGLGPVLPELVEAFTELAPVIGQIAAIFGGVLGTAIQTIVPVIARLASMLAGVLTEALTQLVPYIQEWGTAFQEIATQVMPQLMPLIAQLGSAFISLLPLIIAGAQGFFTLLIPAMRLVGAVAPIIIAAMSGTITIFQGVAIALGALGRVFQSVWNFVAGLTGTTWGQVSSVVRTASASASNAVGAAMGAIRGAIGTLAGIGAQIGGYFRAAVGAVQGAIGALLGVVRGIPGSIRGALGDMGGLLVGAGRDVINGFINGIKQMAGAAAAAARAAVAGVPGAIKGALGISSPSKVTMELGRFTGEGFAIGILKTAARVAAAMATVANMVPLTVATGFEANAVANGSSYGTTAPGIFNNGNPPVAPATPGAGLTVNQTVNALPGQSAKQVGDSAVQRLVFGVVTGTSGLGTAAPPVTGAA